MYSYIYIYIYIYVYVYMECVQKWRIQPQDMAIQLTLRYFGCTITPKKDSNKRGYGQNLIRTIWACSKRVTCCRTWEKCQNVDEEIVTDHGINDVWWFGTFLIFQKYWVSNHPNWRTHIFQRGWHHQPVRPNMGWSARFCGMVVLPPTLRWDDMIG